MLLLLQETNSAGGADPSLFSGCLCSGLAWWGFYLLTLVPCAGGGSTAAQRLPHLGWQRQWWPRVFAWAGALWLSGSMVFSLGH